ncbi:MAG: amidase [Burkholderiaceae bacterium]
MQNLVAVTAAIAEQRLRAQQLIEAAQAQAERCADLNALAYVDWAAALDEARRLDADAAAGRLRGPLHGVPISIKDLYVVRGMPTRAGARVPLPPLLSETSTPRRDEAEAVARLREAGALLFAKANMHEIALGATGESAWNGDVKNPFDPARQAGGSSSGSGAAVAAGIGLASIGSDTGGSVRIPAAFCGVVGFKPSYGAIPLDGALPLSWTCDHAGPLANSVADCALLFEVMARRRATHGAVARRPRLHVPAAWLDGRLQPVVREAFVRLLARLAAQGAELGETTPSLLGQSFPIYTTISRAEAAWVHRDALQNHADGFSDLVRNGLLAGQQLSAVEYVGAMKQRAVLSAEFDAALADCDAFILPTTAVLPPLRGQTEVDVEGGRIASREAVLGQTLAFSMCGLPTLTIPVGLVDGLPLGLQVVGRRGGDAALLALGGWIEQKIGERPHAPGC